MNNEKAITVTEQALTNMEALFKEGAGLMRHLREDRVLVNGGSSLGLSFAMLGDRVIKVCSETQIHDLQFNWARNLVTTSPDSIRISISFATESELLDAQRALELNGNGEARIAIREFIAHVRQETPAQEPIAIKIVNIDALKQPDKVLSVKRDSDGKMSGATIESVT